MSMNCPKCLNKVEEGMLFCPRCGEKLQNDEKKESGTPADPKAEKWVKKARAIQSYPKKKEILLQGLAECPDSRDIRWELLFVGEEPPKKSRSFEFSIIKCWMLQIYRKPEDFSAERRDTLRALLYEDPALQQCLGMFEDPEQKQREYLLRLCREYYSIFLEGDNQLMGNIFGFRLEKNKSKKLAKPAAEMIRRVREDEKLLPDQREQLWKAMYEAYGARTGGKTAYLDESIMKN